MIFVPSSPRLVGSLNAEIHDAHFSNNPTRPPERRRCPAATSRETNARDLRDLLVDSLGDLDLPAPTVSPNGVRKVAHGVAEPFDCRSIFLATSMAGITIRNPTR